MVKKCSIFTWKQTSHTVVEAKGILDKKESERIHTFKREKKIFLHSLAIPHLNYM
jgi:hypothetical protein